VVAHEELDGFAFVAQGDSSPGQSCDATIAFVSTPAKPEPPDTPPVVVVDNTLRSGCSTVVLVVGGLAALGVVFVGVMLSSQLLFR
jgi:hypothetical protein